ncbi:MAG: hypothetical protein JWQ87_1922 [Candidatus Sulfotelmatobacter sp.]|nr:hypothetical protein [Candidatus Sulfotelmatobacter sp.]
MKYVVYCDESRHNGPENHRYMAIGGLWVPEDQKQAISRTFRDLCRSLRLNSEVKWNKTSQSRLPEYKRLIDFFFDSPGLSYRVIVVDQSKVDLARFHGGDQELGFYKFYYQMLKSWITGGNEYLILLDRKQNKAHNRYSDLRRILRRRAALAGAALLDLTVIDSAQTPLLQICDLLTGAVAASCCLDAHSAKLALAEHISVRARLQNLQVRHSSPSFSKFNIFRINLG